MKPYRVIIHYNNGTWLREKLKEMGVVFTERNVFSGFWGVEFRIQKPTGKGAKEKMRQIDSL